MRTGIFVCLILMYSALDVAAQTYEKGLQLVLLHCMSGKSVDNLIAATIQSGTPLVEISSAPYIADRCNARNNDNWLNLRTVVSQLTRAGVKVRVTVFLSDLHRTTASSGFTGRMQAFWTNILSPYAGNGLVSFRAAPSLEDNYPQAEFQNALNYMAAGISSSQFRTIASQFAFRRCPDVGNGYGNSSYVQHSAWGTNVAVRHESHGSAPRPGYPAWSNDGVFVAYPDSSAEACSGCFGTINYSTFQSASGMSVKLLWRPAFNIANVTPGPPITYSPTGFRSDSETAPKFDSREMTVVKAFLRP